MNKRPTKYPFYAMLIAHAFLAVPIYGLFAFIIGEAYPGNWGITWRAIFALGNLIIFINLLKFWLKREIEVDRWDEVQKTKNTLQERVEELKNKNEIKKALL